MSRPALKSYVRWPETNHGVTSWRGGTIVSYLVRFGEEFAVIETTTGGPLMEIRPRELTLAEEPAR